MRETSHISDKTSPFGRIFACTAKCFLFIVCCSCLFMPIAVSSSESVSDKRRAEELIAVQGERYPALLDIYRAYKQNDDRFQYACFLLANMAENHTVLYNKASRPAGKISDLHSVCADSVLWSVEQSVKVWRETPWKNDYTFGQFLEYILPYRIANEPLEYYWKEECVNKFGPRNPDHNLAEAAGKINGKIGFLVRPAMFGNPPHGFTSAMASGIGKCDDRTMLAVMAMRANGIPAAYDFIPYWGSNNNGHSFCSVIKPDGTNMVFQDVKDSGENTFFAYKTPKIYRRSFAVQTQNLLYKYRDSENIPAQFSDMKTIDVTGTHDIGQQDVRVSINPEIKSEIVYLAVFSPAEWYHVAYTKNRGEATLFTDMGNGTDSKGEIAISGEDIGDGILYLPCFYINNRTVPASNPVIVSKNGVYAVTPNIAEFETVTLKRKYPRLGNIINFAGQMTGGIFEGANKADFSDAVELHRINTVPSSHLQKVDTKSEQAYRYVRYRKPQGTFSIGEFQVFGEKGDQVAGNMICCDALAGLEDVGNMTDGDPLTFFSINGLELWAGIQFDKPVKISAIAYCPRTDDNDISPGDYYELLYWNDAWISLGRKQAEEYSLQYDVPKGALLWLKNLTRGREERPFTYENGRQVWW